MTRSELDEARGPTMAGDGNNDLDCVQQKA
jgi:hypothetical protein